MFKTHIIQSYGEDVYNYTRKLQKISKQAAIAKCQWIFLTRCRANNVVSKSLRRKPPIKTYKGRILTRKFESDLIRIAENEAKERYHKHLFARNTIKSSLQLLTSEQDFKTIEVITEKSRESTFVNKRKELQDKFASLHSTKLSKQVVGTSKCLVKPAVLNLVNTPVMPEVNELLDLGPKFVPTPNHIPFMDIVFATEVAALSLETDKKQLNQNFYELRYRVFYVKI